MTTEQTQTESILDPLRKKYPYTTDGILFCIHKLQQDPSLTIPDFREEAAAYGIKLGGRALHSAKVLLGLALPATRKNNDREAEPEVSPPKRANNAPKTVSVDRIEERLTNAIRRIQEEATEDSRRLRTAIESAIRILEGALEASD